MPERHHTACPGSRLLLPPPDQFAAVIRGCDVDAARWLLAVLKAASPKFAKAVASGRLTARDVRWLPFVKRAHRTLYVSKRRAAMSPWAVKCRTWATCLDLRGRDRSHKPTRAEPFRYSTSTWADAVERMLQNKNHHLYRGRNDPWKRWSLTVTKNINRRVEGRYAGRKA